MPTTLTVTPGYQFSANEAVTLAKLNQIASPTVYNAATVIADFETTETLFATGACTVAKRVTFFSPSASGNTIAMTLGVGTYNGQEKFIIRPYNSGFTDIFNLTVAAYASGVESAAASRVFRFPSDETAGGLFLKWDGAAWRAMDRMDAAETITSDAQTASLILPVTVLDSGSGSKALTLPAGWRVGQPKRIVVKTAGCTWTVSGTFANAVTSTTLVSTAVNALDLTWDGVAWQGAIGTGVPAVATPGGEHSVLTSAGGIYDLVPAGAVWPFAMNSAPTGWLACNGAAVSRTTYAGLFTAISTVHGVGDGATTFNVPDLRGMFLRGVGTHGTETTAVSGSFGAVQTDQNAEHNHTTSDTIMKQLGGNNWNGAGGFGGGAGTSAPDVTLANSGGTEARPNNIALLYCVKT